MKDVGADLIRPRVPQIDSEAVGLPAAVQPGDPKLAKYGVKI